MKKRNLNTKLSVSRTTISKLQSDKVLGGARAASGFLSCAAEPVASQKNSCQYSCNKRTCYCL